MDGFGIPLKAPLLVVRAGGGRPVASVDWSRRRATALTSAAACVEMP